MSTTNKYIDDARYASGQRFKNATGLMQRVNTTSNFASATGAAPQNQMIPTSQPYILNLSNTSAGAIATFDLFGANTYLYGGYGTFTAGSWSYQNVSVSSGIANTTYQALLSQSTTKPFSIGQTRIVLTGGSASILTQPISFTVLNQDGTTFSTPLIFQLNSFQQITTQIDNYNSYSIDANSKLTLTNVPANTGFQMLFFPTATLDITASLAGGTVAQSFGNPRLNQQTVMLK